MRALFLRGLTREIAHWRGLPELFFEKTKIPVLSLDLPGAGMFHEMTSPRDLDSYVEFLRQKVSKGDPLILIGISMGGMIALRWSLLYPDEVCMVFTINSSAKNLSGPLKRFNLKEWRVLLEILLTKTVEKKEGLILNLTTNKLDAQKKAEIQKIFVRIQSERPVSVVSSLNQLYVASTFRITQRPKVPVTVIYSKGDRLVDSSCSEELIRFLGAKKAVHPDAGHDLPLDDPQWLLSELAKIP